MNINVLYVISVFYSCAYIASHFIRYISSLYNFKNLKYCVILVNQYFTWSYSERRNSFHSFHLEVLKIFKKNMSTTQDEHL